MKLWWLAQLCLSCFMFVLSILKYIQFNPYLNSLVANSRTTIIALLTINILCTLGGTVRKGFDYNKAKRQVPELFGMAIVDFMVSCIIVGVNGYGLSLEEYRWIGCQTSIICRNLSAYSWYTIAELATAIVISMYSFFTMVYIRCGKKKYSRDLSKEISDN